MQNWFRQGVFIVCTTVNLNFIDFTEGQKLACGVEIRRHQRFNLILDCVLGRRCWATGQVAFPENEELSLAWLTTRFRFVFSRFLHMLNVFLCSLLFHIVKNGRDINKRSTHSLRHLF